MAKEPNLKKLELKVSVNCCDGCKRKVKKILLAVEGVLKAEIDPLQPKVTVLGNVDPQVLIKRLSKAGKQAELWSQGKKDTGKEKKAADMPVVKDKDKAKPECEHAKHLDSCGKTSGKNRDKKNTEDAGESRAPKKDQKEADSNLNSSNTEAVKSENNHVSHLEMNSIKYPSMLQDLSNFKTSNQYSYNVEPYAIAVPYYHIAAYPISPVFPTCYSHEYLQYQKPVCQPPFQSPATQVGDYFSEENTVGCHVM